MKTKGEVQHKINYFAEEIFFGITNALVYPQKKHQLLN